MGRSRDKSFDIRLHGSLTATKRVLLVVALACIGAAGYVLAASSNAEATPTCGPPSLTMADYVALGATGCTMDDKIFSNFTYTNDRVAGGGVVNASDVAVTPVPIQGNPGFTFTGPFTVLPGHPGAFTEGIIQFDIQTITGEALIKDASLSAVQSGTGSFRAEAFEQICLGASFSPACNTVVTLDVSNTNNSSGDAANFAPQSLVGVHASLNAIAGFHQVDGATLTSATVQYSELPSTVPEPATVALFGTGLLGLAGRRLLRPAR